MLILILLLISTFVINNKIFISLELKDFFFNPKAQTVLLFIINTAVGLFICCLTFILIYKLVKKLAFVYLFAFLQYQPYLMKKYISFRSCIFFAYKVMIM